MTTEVIVRNAHNGDTSKAIVVRAYYNKGNTAAEPVALHPGEEGSFYLDATSTIQVDEIETHAAGNKGVKPQQAPVDGRTEWEKAADEEAAASRLERGVTKEDDVKALAHEAMDDFDEEFDKLFDDSFDDEA